MDNWETEKCKLWRKMGDNRCNVNTNASGN